MPHPRASRRTRRTLVLAGTAGLATALVAVTAPGSASASVFGSPVVVTSDQVSEPGVDVAPDGTVYVNGPAGLLSSLPGSPSRVYRSDNGGASFSPLPDGLKADLPGGGDSDITIDPVTGALAETDLWLGSSTVATSTDKGQTWTASPVQGVVVQDRQWVSTPGGGRVYHVTHQIPAGIVVSRSIDGGLTYPQSTVAGTVLDQAQCVCPPGNLISENGGLLGDKVGVVYATGDGGVAFSRSTNGGLTWTVTRPGPASSATTNGSFPVVADAGSGHLVTVWNAQVGDRLQVLLSRSSDFGQTWSAPVTLLSGGTNLYPWVDARGSKVSVSVFHTDTAGLPDTLPASATWYETYLESTDGGATFGAQTTVDSTPVKTGPICTGGINCSGNRELGDFQQVALDKAGNAYLTWARSIDGTRTEVRLVRQA